MSAPTAPPEPVDPLLLEAARRILRDTCTAEALERAEADGWAAGVWDPLAEAGFPWIGVAEAAGGSGGSLIDALAVLRIAGAVAAPVPLAESGLLAGWLLAGAGFEIPPGVATVVPGRPGDTVALRTAGAGWTVSGRATRVPWGGASQSVVVLAAVDDVWHVALVPATATAVERAANLAGEPRDTLSFDGHTEVEARPAAHGVDDQALRLRGALARATQMAGALEAMSQMTIAYASERRQFAKPIASFQAVQQHLVHGAQDAAIVGVAATVAGAAAAVGPAPFEIAAAKLLAGQAATTATRAAHQAHGAMGMTREYGLHHLTRRLWAWQAEHGDERHWAGVLGRSVVAAGPDRLYPTITGGSAVLEG